MVADLRRLQSMRCPLEMGEAIEADPAGLTDPVSGARTNWYYGISVGYRKMKDGRPAGRIPATPESVYKTVVSVLRLANRDGVRSLALPLMCARPGYSTVPSDRAGAVMAESMIRAINDTRPELGITRIDLYVPSSVRDTTQALLA